MSEPSAGWHPDPFRRFESRYWDGHRWTEHVETHGRPATDAPVETPPPGRQSPQAADGWHADPYGRYESRYWDGSRWTEHVATGGHRAVDRLVDLRDSGRPAQEPSGAVARDQRRIQKQIDKVGLADPSGTPDLSLLNEPVLVVNQKGKLVELRAEYAIHSQSGAQLAVVRGKRMSSRMQVVDLMGRRIIDIRREGSLVSSKMIVGGPSGEKVGRIVPSVSLKHLDRAFKLEGPNDRQVGSVFCEDGRRRRRDFNVQDAGGNVVAHISKTRAGIAKEILTKGDNYVLSYSGSPSESLRLMSIASTLVIDTDFHQR